MRLQNKVCFVTGAARGIGKAIAIAFASEGASVVITDVHDKLVNETLDEVQKLSPMSIGIRMDVRHKSEVEKAFEVATSKLGKIDVLANNAGVFSMYPLNELTEEEWDRVMDTNVKGMFLCSTEAARYMVKARNGGRIINTASIAGKVGAPTAPHYCASKFAVIGLTLSLALELGPFGITVNAVCPAQVESEMLSYEITRKAELDRKSVEEVRKAYVRSVALGRLAQPEDIAKAFVFLASDDGSYVTGQALEVTGGLAGW